MYILEERAQDAAAIHALTRSAFEGRPYADGDEQDVIDRLRAAGDLTLSLIALEDDTIVGQCTWSPASCTDGSGPWYALGPVSVSPERQGEGIGGALIDEGLERLRASGALGCILTGATAYYRRFGFEGAATHAPEIEPAEHFMLCSFTGARPHGRFGFHRAFYGEV